MRMLQPSKSTIMGPSYLQSSIGHRSNTNNYRRQYNQYSVRTEVLMVIGHRSNNKQSKVLTVSIGHWSNEIAHTSRCCSVTQLGL